MTIAACYVSPEGVVLGADSASTHAFPTGAHHFNYGQKLFEVGNKSTLGLVTWGLGGLALGSYRTLIARLADELPANPVSSVSEVAERWAELIWPLYSALPDVQLAQTLSAKAPFVPGVPADPSRRTLPEEMQFVGLLQRCTLGFCIGGYVLADRQPVASEIVFSPTLGKPSPQNLPMAQSMWGVPAFINRLINGCADEVRQVILGSGRWNGTPQDFDTLLAPHKLNHPPTVPIREAIDFCYACIFTTIKAMKFSSFPRVCGGPIEIAVITTDRPFRWVKHKELDAAIWESEA